MKKLDIQFNLSAADKSLFVQMRHSYQSDSERKFFEIMKRKEQYESAFSNELLVYEKENDDRLYILRKYYDTYVVGYCQPNGRIEEYECETLSALLFLQLDKCVGFPYVMSVLQWLRKFDYSFVKYNRNYDND